MQHVFRVAVFDGPNDAALRAIGGNTWGCARVTERGRTLGLRRGGKFGLRELKLQKMICLRSEVEIPVEVSGSTPFAGFERTIDFLVNSIVIVGIELSHVRAVHEINVLVLACAHG